MKSTFIPAETSDLTINGIKLFDYGIIKYANRFQMIGSTQLQTWLSDRLSADELIKTMEAWAHAEKNHFNDEKKYQDESVYCNLMFRFDILTRMAKKDSLPMHEVFDHLRHFFLARADFFETLTRIYQTQKADKEEGIHSYHLQWHHRRIEKNITLFWQKYLFQKNTEWKDALVAENARLLMLLPKAIESNTRLSSEKRPRMGIFNR